jgi:hypothetical protein
MVATAQNLAPGLLNVPRPDHVRRTLQALHSQLRLARQLLRLSVRIHETIPPPVAKQAEVSGV